MSSRLGRIDVFVVVLLALALGCAPGAQAALPAGYAPAPVDDPAPVTGGAFGQNMVNAGDVTGDAVDDLLVGVPDAPGGLPGITGKIVFVNGQSGAPITTVRPPDTDTLISHVGDPTDFGAQVATIGDLTGDGVSEHAVSAPGSDVSASAVDMGIVYVRKIARLRLPASARASRRSEASRRAQFTAAPHRVQRRPAPRSPGGTWTAGERRIS